MDSTLCHFSFIVTFFMLCESGFLMKYSSVCYRERKRQGNFGAWGQESVCISVIVRVHNSRVFVLVIFLCVLPGG